MRRKNSLSARLPIRGSSGGKPTPPTEMAHRQSRRNGTHGLPRVELGQSRSGRGEVRRQPKHGFKLGSRVVRASLLDVAGGEIEPRLPIVGIQSGRLQKITRRLVGEPELAERRA